MIDTDDHDQILADPNATTDELRSIIAELRQEVAWSWCELSNISTAIGTTVYMDPPDGGSPTLAEQVVRMAKDAARYRWLHDHTGEHQGPEVFIDGGYWLGNELDEQIDAAITNRRT